MTEEIGKSVLVAEFLLILALAQIGNAQQPQAGPAEKPPQSTGETLIIGTTTLRLGMSENSVVPVLGMEYNLVVSELVSPDRHYIIMAGKSRVGHVVFNAQGNLVRAQRILTPEPRHYSDGEIGRMLVASIASLVSEGQRACSIEAGQFPPERLRLQIQQPPGARVVNRDATIECGGKRIIIFSTTWDGTDSMDIAEEIESPEHRRK